MKEPESYRSLSAPLNLHTSIPQIAKEKLPQLESSLLRGDDTPLPTRTPLPTFLSAFTNHLYATKQPKNADKIVSYLGEESMGSGLTFGHLGN